MNSFLGMFLTILSGVFVFAISQYIMVVWVNPLQKYKELKGKVTFLLINYSCYYVEPLNLMKNQTEEMKKFYRNIKLETRALAAEISGFIEIVPKIHPGIPTIEVLRDASRNLIGLSNGMFRNEGIEGSEYAKNNREEMKRIRNLLKIKDKE